MIAVNADGVLEVLHELADESESAATVRNWLVVDQNGDRGEKPTPDDVMTVLEPDVGGDRVVLALEAADATRYVATVESTSGEDDSGPDFDFVRYDDAQGDAQGDAQATVDRIDVRGWIHLALDTGRLGFAGRDDFEQVDGASFADGDSGGEQGVGA